MTRRLLTEGGMFGHMNHLYDDPSITFNKVAEILTAAAAGEIVGTEKTDGFNIYLGYVGGRPRWARNDGEAARGGKDIDDLKARVFQGGEEVKDIYIRAFTAYENLIGSMSEEELATVFGKNGEIFFNAEVQGPLALDKDGNPVIANVVNYDANVLSIHETGMVRVLPDGSLDKEIDPRGIADRLDASLDRFEEMTSGEDFSVRRTATLKLRAMADDSVLRDTLARIQQTGFTGDMTIAEYIASNLEASINSELGFLDDETKKDIIHRIILKKPKTNVGEVLPGPYGERVIKGVRDFQVGRSREERVAIGQFVKTAATPVKELIIPIEEAIHDFTVELLAGLESAYILDNKAELDRLRAEVKDAIEQIEVFRGEGWEKAHEFLGRQLSKLKHHDNVNTTVEGFVFQWGDKLYKFTGNFAPINQILGLFKYPRGSMPAIRQDEPAPQEETGEISCVADIAIIPGAFKPPHRGHVDLVKHYASLASEVRVLVSNPTSNNQKRYTPSGREVTPQDAVNMWNLYLQKAGIPGNVTVEISASPSPVGAAFAAVYPPESGGTGDQLIGKTVALGVSMKGGDQSRFEGMIQTNAQEGVTVLTQEDCPAFKPVGEELSATDFRNSMEGGDITPWLPEGVEPQDVYDVLGEPPAQEPENGAEPPPPFFMGESLLQMVEALMDETTELNEHTEPIQKTWAARHPPQKKRLIASGGNTETGGGEGWTRPDMTRAASAPPGFGAIGETEELEEWGMVRSVAQIPSADVAGIELGLEEEEELLDEMSAMAGGAVAGTAGPFPGLDKEEDRDDLTIRRSSKKSEETLIREEDNMMIDEIMNYLLPKRG